MNIVLAKFWDSFKQKNPEAATAITALGMLVVGMSMFAEDLNLDLPDNLDKWMIGITTFILSFNNPSTYKILNPPPTEEP